MANRSISPTNTERRKKITWLHGRFTVQVNATPIYLPLITVTAQATTFPEYTCNEMDNTTVTKNIDNPRFLLWKCSYLCSEASLEMAHPYKSLPHLSQTGFSASDSGFLICFCICGKSISSTSLSAFDASASSSWLKTVPFRYQLAISLHLQDIWSY